MSKQITTRKVKLIEGLMYRCIEKKILKSNLECMITNTFSEDIPLCNDVGLFVWAPNIIVHCITELCYFLRKFLGNSNAVGLGKKKIKEKLFAAIFHLKASLCLSHVLQSPLPLYLLSNQGQLGGD